MWNDKNGPEKSIYVENRLLPNFGSPAHLAWTPQKIENAKNELFICKILGQYQKNGQNLHLGSILASLLFVDRKFEESGPFLCLFIIIVRTTWLNFFLYISSVHNSRKICENPPLKAQNRLHCNCNIFVEIRMPRQNAAQGRPHRYWPSKINFIKN